MTANETGAPVHKSGAIPAEEEHAAKSATMAGGDPLRELDADARRRLAEIAGTLIPAAHGMPSAADVLNDDRLHFVLRARPDLLELLQAALRPELGDQVAARLAALEQEEPANLAALQLAIVSGYYTDRRVRELIGYPGQLAIQVRSWELPPYLEEGLIDAVLVRGPVWRDPATGQRAEDNGYPTTYADRWSGAGGTAEGGSDGRQGS